MALQGNIVHPCVLMASKRRRWDHSILAGNKRRQKEGKQTYLPDFVFCHAPLNVGFIQKDQKTSSYQALNSLIMLVK